MRSNGALMKSSSLVIAFLSTRSAMKARSSPRSLSTARNRYLRKSSATRASSARSAKAISGSIIQNSARWRVVWLFSARKVGPKV